MNRKTVAAAVLLVLVGVTTAILLRSGPPRGREPRIGSLLILSGPYAPYGQQIESGQRLAEAYLEAQGVSVDHIQPVDFGNDKQRAEQLFRRMVRQDSVVFFAALMGTSAVLQMAPVIDSLRVVVIDGTATGDTLSSISSGFFRTIPRDGAAADQVLTWIGDEGQAGRIMLLFANTDWGTGLRDSYLRAARDKEMAIDPQRILELPQGASAEQVQAAASRVKDVAPTALVLAVYGADAAALIRRLKERSEVIPPVYGTDNFVGEFAQTGGTFVEGARYVIVTGGAVRDTVRQMYSSMFGPPPGGEIPAYVITGFNAFVAAADAYRATGGDPLKARDWLVSTSIVGAEGPFGFQRNGDLATIRFQRRQFVASNGSAVSQPFPSS